MHITMGLPTFLPRGRDVELSWHRKIDEGPWDGLAISDTLLHPHGWALPIQLAAAAATTERVRLWTAVAVLPLRNSVLFAKEMATVDVLSGGRLMLGVGIGGREEDYQATGVDASLRRQRMDEQVATMQRIWSQAPPLEGQAAIGPRPVQPNGVPLIAGVAGPKAIARAAKWAAGVNDASTIFYFEGEQLNAQRKRVAQAWRDAGRSEKPHFSGSCLFALGPDAKAQLAKSLFELVGLQNADYAREAIESSNNYGETGLRSAVEGARLAGLDDFILMPTTSDPDELDRARDVLGI
jgi:alkanesulfonate monooxygenase SsuD/methylene tetrahydromethanopterin reductase-like flavin-dependent oxidoreductase (luciferase family)